MVAGPAKSRGEEEEGIGKDGPRPLTHVGDQEGGGETEGGKAGRDLWFLRERNGQRGDLNSVHMSVRW